MAHLPDAAAIQSYAERHPVAIAAVEVAGMRSIVGVPMLKDNELVGVISIYRQEVRPFTDKQIELLTNFAGSALLKTALISRSEIHDWRERERSPRDCGARLRRGRKHRPRSTGASRRPLHHRHARRLDRPRGNGVTTVATPFQ